MSELVKSINVKVIFLKEERNINVSEEELLEDFQNYLEIASETRSVSFNYYCALKKLFEEGEIEIKLICKQEKYVYDLDKENENKKRILEDRKEEKEYKQGLELIENK